jgi:hypothetical protein
MSEATQGDLCMNAPDRTKPQIYIERARGIHVIHLVVGDGQRACVVITRTRENAAAIDYFYQKLKDGLNL